MEKFVYLDFGGVMVEIKPSLLAIADRLGVEHQRFLTVWEPLDDAACRGDISSRDLWENCFERLEITDHHDDLTLEWIQGFKVCTKVHTLTKQISRLCSVGILSNMYKDFFPTAVAMGMIPNISYQSIVLSCEQKTIKPDPIIYKIAEQMAGVDPSQLVLLDDKPANVKVADERGWHGVLFESNIPHVAMIEILDLVKS